MTVAYEDKRMTLDDEGITIRRYYLPFAGSKRVPYENIERILDRKIDKLTGQLRFFGMGLDFKYWFHEDHSRLNKQRAFVVETGGRIRMVLTPEDHDAVRKVLENKVGERLGPAEDKNVMAD